MFKQQGTHFSPSRKQYKLNLVVKKGEEKRWVDGESVCKSKRIRVERWTKYEQNTMHEHSHRTNIF